jgi:uncharacterized protein YecT (DUF1311 family)
MNSYIIRSGWIAATLLGWSLLASPAQAASFDCSKASTPQEKLICFDYRLSDLDSQLAWTYTEALKQAKDTSALKQSQKDWVAAREKCTNVNCILHAYVGKIEALNPEARLDEVYFPKAEIPWDFSPQPGYKVSNYAEIKENKLTFTTYLKGTMTHGEDLIIPQDKPGVVATKSEHETENHLQGLALVNNKFELDPIGENRSFVELGGMHLAYVSSSYGECQGGLGMSGIYVGRNVLWTKDNVLVELRPHDWTVWKRSHDACYEAQLKIDPTMMVRVVYNQSLYLSEYRGESDYVLRLDRNLQTASPMLGKKIFLGWGNDLEALTGKACDKFVDSSMMGLKIYSTKHRICIDQQLQNLIGEVGRYYQLRSGSIDP